MLLSVSSLFELDPEQEENQNRRSKYIYKADLIMLLLFINNDTIIKEFRKFGDGIYYFEGFAVDKSKCFFTSSRKISLVRGLTT